MPLSLRCSCGTVRGRAHGLSPETGQRVICYCEDCQTFARFLGRADEILDPNGGTDIFQTSPARLELTSGTERLACVRVTPRGPLRWYADCCRTPIGNTPAATRVPFVGLVLRCVVTPETGVALLDETIGPVWMRCAARDARGKPAGDDVHDGFPLRLYLGLHRIVLRAWLRGDAKRSPFVDAATGTPIREPRLLEKTELERYRSRD